MTTTGSTMVWRRTLVRGRSAVFGEAAPASPASGGGTVRHMVYHSATRTIWFGTDTNQLGKAVIPKAEGLVP